MEIRKPESYPYVTVAAIPFNEISRIDMDVCKQPTETLEEYYSRQQPKPTILTNLGFFNMTDGTPCFNFINDSKVLAYQDWCPEGLGLRDEKDIQFGSANDHTYNKWRDFCSGYPMLVKDWTPVSTSIAAELNYKARRTVIGYNNTHLFVITVDSPGMNFEQLKKMLVEMGVKCAMNCDGGGSTQMLYKGEIQTIQAWSRPVDTVFAVYTKAPTKTVYRVQCGAFKSKANAESLKNKIAANGNPYSNAYVRQVNGLWKVQIGAFSVRANADNMMKGLKELGFSAFITT